MEVFDLEKDNNKPAEQVSSVTDAPSSTEAPSSDAGHERKKGPNLERFLNDLKLLINKDPDYFNKTVDAEKNSPLKSAMKRWKYDIEERAAGVVKKEKDVVTQEAKRKGYLEARISVSNAQNALRDFSLIQSVLSGCGISIRAIDTSDKSLDQAINQAIKLVQLSQACDRVGNALDFKDERKPELAALKARLVQAQQSFWSKCEELRTSGNNLLNATRRERPDRPDKTDRTDRRPKAKGETKPKPKVEASVSTESTKSES